MPHRLTLFRLHAISPFPNRSLQRKNALLICTRPLQHKSHFHSTARRYATASDDNHYTTLEITPSATQAQIKKQFYTLSKRYHPDLHPDDSTASQRFVRISSAWAILGNETKRAAYDRDLMRIDPAAFGASHASSAGGYGARGGPAPSGSHSSAQAYGARPASGLSKRRGTFRGPPPSFYRSGGWGAHESKRKAAADGAREDAERTARASAAGASGMGGGFSPGQGQGHADFEVPHFDREDHYRRQENVEEALKRRRVIMAEREAMRREYEQSSVMARVMIVSGALLFTAVLGAVWDRSTSRKKKD